MSFFLPRRAFDPEYPELMDRSWNDPTLLEEDLMNLRRINKYFGGIAAMRRSILPLLAKVKDRDDFSILDIGAGAADLPIEMVKMTRREGWQVHITTIDKNPQILAIAKREAAHFPEVSVMPGDALDLGYADKSFDVVICSLVIHHFSDNDAIKVLREMNRISRIGFVVNDLTRGRFAAWLVWLYAHITSGNPLTRNDSPASILRAFTPSELSSMAHEAGIRNFAIETRPFFRLLLVCVHQ